MYNIYVYKQHSVYSQPQQQQQQQHDFDRIQLSLPPEHIMMNSALRPTSAP